MVQTIIFLIVGGIIYLITWSYKKVDKKVDDYKILRNPDDVGTLEKKLLKSIREKNITDALRISQKIIEIDESNLLALMVSANHIYESQGEYDATVLFKKLVLHLFNETSLKSLILRTNSISHNENWNIVHLLIAKTYYYHGYINYLNKQFQDAEIWKAKAKKYSSSVLRKNLY